MSSRVGVRAIFSAAHHDLRGRAPVHGHTYEVIAWFRRGDQVDLQRRLVTLLADRFDHRELRPGLSRAEAIAAAIRHQLKARGVEVNRPLEGLYARVGVCG